MSELELEPHDYLYALQLDFDVDAQLIAIRGLLHRNRKANEELENEIKQIEEHSRRLNGVYAERASDAWVDHVHHSVYQGAAHSMSAVGMLAPLVETVFYQCFRGIGNRFFPASHPTQKHERWNAAHAIQWDCHLLVVGNRSERNLVRGILQLSDAVGLASRLPSDLKPTLSALFAYRNNMFHHGFEWPIEERDLFAKRIADERWPSDWFSEATSGDKPWIFYLSDKFIEHCLTTIDNVLDTIGVFVRDELPPKEAAS
jgi:hypothetical protein